MLLSKANGYIGDNAITVPVGAIDPQVARLLQTTEEALQLGIRQAQVGHRIGDISHAIQTFVEARGFGVVRDLVGHGVGRTMHEEPQIPNFGRRGKGDEIKPGMTLAIEPMSISAPTESRRSPTAGPWSPPTACLPPILNTPCSPPKKVPKS